MVKQFIVTQLSDDGDTILSHNAATEEVFPIVVADTTASNVLCDFEQDAREAAIKMSAGMSGFFEPHESVEGAIYERTYRVELLPEDPLALDEFYNARLFSSKLLSLVYRVPGKLRIEIWPNESQHRGRPHCRVSNKSKSASFTIPDGELLVGNLSPDERQAKTTIREHGDELLNLWHRMLPDDQKL